MLKLTFLGKVSASHKLLADLSICRDRLETGISLLHYVTPEYFMLSSTDVSEKKNYPTFQGFMSARKRKSLGAGDSSEVLVANDNGINVPLLSEMPRKSTPPSKLTTISEWQSCWLLVLEQRNLILETASLTNHTGNLGANFVCAVMN